MSAAPAPITSGRRRAAAVVAVAGIAVGTTVWAAAAAPAQAATGRSTSTYSVSAKGVVTGPATQLPGRAALRITGKAGEAFQLVRSRHGAGVATLITDANTLNSSGKAADLERDFTLYGGTSVGQTMWVTLIPGSYYAVDTNTEKPSAAGVKHITVAPGNIVDAYPRWHEIRAVGSETWAADPASIPASGTIRFSNHASQPHFIVLQRLKPGKTKADILKALNGKEKEDDVFYTGQADEADSGVISPRSAFFFSYSLPRGNYALMCFWPDAKTGMPHALMGMDRVIALT